MGYFTWTLANKKPKLNRAGDDYTAASKLAYDGRGFVQCPNGTVIEEPCYEGYGIFNGQDIYELVVDWNRASLRDIMTVILKETSGMYYELACALADRNASACPAIAEKYVKAGKIGPYVLKDWKRSLGIHIACGDKNAKLPCPIKITDTRNPRLSYNDLPASISCQ